jgi:hypothetical protein
VELQRSPNRWTPPTVGDLQNWSGKRWNYDRAEHYGSPEFQVTNPQKPGSRAAGHSPRRSFRTDGRSVTLGIADFKPVMQQAIKWDLKAKDGTPVAQDPASVHVVRCPVPP